MSPELSDEPQAPREDNLAVVELQPVVVSETSLQKAKRFGGAVVAMVAVAFTGEYEY